MLHASVNLLSKVFFLQKRIFRFPCAIPMGLHSPMSFWLISLSQLVEEEEELIVHGGVIIFPNLFCRHNIRRMFWIFQILWCMGNEPIYGFSCKFQMALESISLSSIADNLPGAAATRCQNYAVLCQPPAYPHARLRKQIPVEAHGLWGLAFLPR